MIFGFYYFDIAVCFILLIAIITGLRKGLIKMLFGLISSLVALACAIMLVMPVTNFVIESTPIDDYLVHILKEPIAKNQPILDSPIVYYDHDADPSTDEILGFYYNDTLTPVHEIIEQSNLLNMFSTQIDKMLAKIVPPEGLPSALFAITSVLVAYLLIPVDFILIWAFVSILLSLIARFLSLMAKRVASLYFLNRLAGVAISVAYAVIFLLIAITLLDFTASNPIAAEIKTSYVDNSAIGGFLVSINPLTQLLEKLDFTSWIDKIMKSIGLGK